MTDKIEHDWTDEPVCPHCGAQDIDWWDGTSLRDDGDFEIVECMNCGEEFRQTISVSYSFTTDKISRDNSSD